jgi:hypothetical protein
MTVNDVMLVLSACSLTAALLSGVAMVLTLKYYKGKFDTALKTCEMAETLYNDLSLEVETVKKQVADCQLLLNMRKK